MSSMQHAHIIYRANLFLKRHVIYGLCYIHIETVIKFVSVFLFTVHHYFPKVIYYSVATKDQILGWTPAGGRTASYIK